MRRFAILASSVWLAVFVSIALFTLFWRIGYFRPHVLWGLLSLVLMFTPMIWLAASALRRVVRGPCRLRVVGWLLVGAAPLVSVAAYLTQLSLHAYAHTSPAMLTPLYVAMVWASPMLDIEAWRCGLRRTHGQHTVLIDNGRTPFPEKLVAEMDHHIEGMADLIGQPVPDEEFPWVRCSLFGIRSVTIPPWAMCCHDDNPDKLTYLDRHEVAHALMMVLSGPDYDPPSLLAEGWAESQSSDRNHQIRNLAERHKQQRTYSLQELVSPAMYHLGGTDSPPAYWEGGPLAHYLMQRYGPATFFRLCSGVRCDSFREDCRAILGDSWETVEENFWKWIDAEGESLLRADAKHPSTTPAVHIELADSVNPADWQALVEGYRETNKDSEWLPSSAAFVLEGKRVERGLDASKSSKHITIEFRAIFEGERFWIFDSFRVGGDSFLMATPGRSADLQRDNSGSFRGRGTPAWPRDSAFELLAFYQHEVDPANLLPLGRNPFIETTYRIEQVVRPIQGQTSRWNVKFTRRGAKDESEMRCQVELDPQQQWRTTRVVRESKEGWRFESDTESRYLGDALMPVVQHMRLVDKQREVTVDSHARPMSEVEQQELKHRVEQAAQSGTTSAYAWLRRLLLAIVIGFPLGGVALLILAPRCTAEQTTP